MKTKHLFLTMAGLLAAGGLGFWWTAGGAHALPKSNPGGDFETPPGQPPPGHTLRPPDPTRRFRELTPEQRVQRVRQGPIGG